MTEKDEGQNMSIEKISLKKYEVLYEKYFRLDRTMKQIEAEWKKYLIGGRNTGSDQYFLIAGIRNILFPDIEGDANMILHMIAEREKKSDD